MSDVEILAGALVLLGLYATVLQVRYSRLVRWAKSAQLALIMGQLILSEVKEEEDEEPTDS